MSFYRSSSARSHGMNLGYLAVVIGVLATGCAGPVGTAEESVDEAEEALSANLVFTTYYDCDTLEIVGEKTFGCYPGPGSLQGVKTTCYEVESDECQSGALAYLDYCAQTDCERFLFEPTKTYPEWFTDHE